MKRRIPGLHRDCSDDNEILGGLFLARVERIYYRWHPLRPHYALRFSILQPQEYRGHNLTARLYCTPRGLWKLRWFLRDFGYEDDLMGMDGVDEKALLGLQGIIRISRTSLNAGALLNLDGFAPASEWQELVVPAGGRP